MLVENIRREAEKKGISIYKLEVAADLSNGLIATWDKHYPRVDRLKAVADVLGVTVDELLKEGR